LQVFISSCCFVPRRSRAQAPTRAVRRQRRRRPRTTCWPNRSGWSPATPRAHDRLSRAGPLEHRCKLLNTRFSEASNVMVEPDPVFVYLWRRPCLRLGLLCLAERLGPDQVPVFQLAVPLRIARAEPGLRGIPHGPEHRHSVFSRHPRFALNPRPKRAHWFSTRSISSSSLRSESRRPPDCSEGPLVTIET
jgi:hypothetical protein